MHTVTKAIHAEELTKTYGEGTTQVSALRDVDLDVPPGRFVVLLGPSGSGKTTLLNLIGAMEPPTSGSITAAGTELSNLDEAGRTQYRLSSVGFVFQFYNLVPTLTALENVALIAELTGADAAARSERVLCEVGLADRLDHFPAEMSGGEQQRVSIARALVKNPPLLLCDEPTGALDVGTGAQILGVLRTLVEDGGRTVLVVTHNREIARIAHRVIELRDGRVIDERENPDPAPPSDLDW